ncbi:hypothetical protein M378DRAFT_168003 [Amanita muscaria Koide BX008]|uniref:BTB domain-containing protein n=1 Tax=Amanita muscaria (strain Koide BX008) TaxID=946122 RepID=A0A0C2WGH1_AMAMK|nr:hypothetical protein M378DRAFT_168003 [Amanita muscaria Koide BX008]
MPGPATEGSTSDSKLPDSEFFLLQHKFSPKFNASDAEVTFQSCDGLCYRIHRKNLECTAAAFPAAEFVSKKEDVVPMLEHSEVLDLLFVFMYPERQPNLRKVAFRVLADLAEAAEKFQVYSAMHTCNTYMVLETEKHPLDVLVYAARHDYQDLLDKAAALVIGLSLDTVIDRMPPAIAVAWVRYYQKWRDAYSKAILRPTRCTCAAWSQNVVLPILDKLGGKIEMLSKPDDLFLEIAVVNNCCSNHLTSWRNHIGTICENIPKFSTLL